MDRHAPTRYQSDTARTDTDQHAPKPTRANTLAVQHVGMSTCINTHQHVGRSPLTAIPAPSLAMGGGGVPNLVNAHPQPAQGEGVFTKCGKYPPLWAGWGRAFTNLRTPPHWAGWGWVLQSGVLLLQPDVRRYICFIIYSIIKNQQLLV